jgi:stage II sporulation protein R
MKYFKKYQRLGVVLLIVAALGIFYENAHLQESYAKEVVRFHVLANSDSTEDQECKLQVRNQIGGYVTSLLQGVTSKQETLDCIQTHLAEIKEVAEQEVKRQGYDYTVQVSLEQVDFPEKTYGAYTLPEGNYTSLQVRIGEAEGENWWCVMYPNMCFLNSTYEVVDQQEKEQMYQVFTLYEYRKLIESSNKEIRFRLFGN